MQGSAEVFAPAPFLLSLRADGGKDGSVDHLNIPVMRGDDDVR